MHENNEWFPVASVSKEVNIPPETVRRYARQYRDFLNIKRGEKKAYLIHESSFATIRKIRSLYQYNFPIVNSSLIVHLFIVKIRQIMHNGVATIHLADTLASGILFLYPIRK